MMGRFLCYCNLITIMFVLALILACLRQSGNKHATQQNSNGNIEPDLLQYYGKPYFVPDCSQSLFCVVFKHHTFNIVCVFLKIAFFILYLLLFFFFRGGGVLAEWITQNRSIVYEHHNYNLADDSSYQI